ncbi:hypothetical protein BT96DRAFT_1000429 [Gymnopus androsaceus JB14]|uniref:Uncharacterized protein n=1 Tax=Gymnopus androsaceus JB14 TaxID=1447944 RepID=A0A6A4H3L2_9AGAR|nr:hypothetical protein BT96DRAFT_1000429 [Gymnopus androsaceus JB14]
MPPLNGSVEGTQSPDNLRAMSARPKVVWRMDIGKECHEWSPTHDIRILFFLQVSAGLAGAHYEDLYRGLCYIILRCSVLRNALFTWLGSPELTSRFTSATDWVRWLVFPTSESFTKLTNYMTLVWVYFQMFAEGALPKEELEFDDIENDPLLFSIAQ